MVKKTDRSSKVRSANPKNSVITLEPKTLSILESGGIENYEPCGRFETDFGILCQNSGVDYCPVVKNLNLNLYSEQLLPNVLAPKRSKDKSGSPTSLTKENSQINQDITPSSEVEPTTFSVVPSQTFFTPTIHTLVEVADKPETVTEVHIRGWGIGDTIFGILLKCFQVATNVHTLNFWRVGLTVEQVTQLVSFLATNNNIKQLTIDANEPLTPDCLAQLIQHEGSLEMLRLRQCCLGPTEAKEIAARLGTTKSANDKLLRLDLSGNRLGDDGAMFIAQALRTNRALNMLSLSDNHIGDVGAHALAEVLSQYFLTHEEVVQRRILQSEEKRALALAQESAQSPSPITGRRAKKDNAISDTASEGSEKRMERRNRSRTGRNEGSEKEDRRGPRSRKPEQTTPKRDGRKSSGRSLTNRSTRVGAITPEIGQFELVPSRPDSAESTNPLLGNADYIDPNGLQVVGNFVLAFLNLSRNRITESGLTSFLKAMETQTVSKPNGSGLLKLLLTGNLFESQCPIFMQLMDILEQRDPMIRPTTSSDREATPTEQSPNK